VGSGPSGNGKNEIYDVHNGGLRASPVARWRLLLNSLKISNEHTSYFFEANNN